MIVNETSPGFMMKHVFITYTYTPTLEEMEWENDTEGGFN